MARRGKKTIKPLWIVVAVVLVAGTFFVSHTFLPGTGEAYRTTPLLDVDSYLENANSLRSNVYRIEGEVVNSLAWSPSSGRLFAVSVNNGASVLPVLVTREFNDLNIQKGQKFIFLLEVDDRGILRTKNLTKA